MRRYLIVDDNLAFAENLAEIIRDNGDETVVVTDGRTALEHVRASRFDALISDMKMPVMSGAELVHELRRIDPGLPALVITAYTNDDDLKAARQEGLLAVLPKPVPIERLLSLLADARRDGLVALVDDDLAFADNVGEVLRDRGYSAVTAGSVLETERLGSVRPFCALVDLRMPGGPDGTAMSRLAQKFPGLPLLVVTAHDHVPPEPHEGIFRKPFDTASLLATVDRMWESRRA
jgi:CheY-like chemotaxis protein